MLSGIKEEWGESGGRVDLVVMGVLCSGEPFRPIVLFIVGVYAQVMFYFLVYALSLTISLRMIGGGGGCFGSNKFVQSIHETGDKDRSLYPR